LIRDLARRLARDLAGGLARELAREFALKRSAERGENKYCRKDCGTKKFHARIIACLPPSSSDVIPPALRSVAKGTATLPAVAMLFGEGGNSSPELHTLAFCTPRRNDEPCICLCYDAVRGSQSMKSKGTSKGMQSKQAPAKTSVSRDKVRKMRDDSHAAKKIGKITTPLGEKRSGTRANRRVTKEALKEVQTKFNG